MKNHVSFPIDIIFRNISFSQAMHSKILSHASKLNLYCEKIMGCRVTIETHHHQHKGNIYGICVALDVPGKKIIVNRELDQHHAHEDAYVAIRDAFRAISKQLQTYMSRQKNQIKHHMTPLDGYVHDIAPLADVGYIETTDGRMIRFSSNSVVDYNFDDIEVGDHVFFVESASRDGIAASTVHVR